MQWSQEERRPLSFRALRGTENMNPGKTMWWMVIALVLLITAATRQARAQTEDPFAAFDKDLGRAADRQLKEMQERERWSAIQLRVFPSTPTDARLAAWAISTDSTAGRLEAARRRLGVLGVDAARIFREEGVPVELLLLAGVESNYDPFALSPKGARGIWQLMPATAMRFGLRLDGQVDERTHPTRSTRAAAQYLRRLYLQFGDWLLAVAAYNAGENRISNAIKRAGTNNFWTLAAGDFLPRETRDYVPAFLRAQGRSARTLEIGPAQLDTIPIEGPPQ
jgi:hypothetical protein